MIVVFPKDIPSRSRENQDENTLQTITGNIETLGVTLENMPKTEELTNLRSIYTAILVGDDGRVYQSMRSLTGGCRLSMVRDGKVVRGSPPAALNVQGICGNRRMIDAEAYIKQLTPERVCVPVKAIIGAVDNQAMVTELKVDLLDGAKQLNPYQQKVVDLTRMKASNVIVGPPGTGKSKTIVNLIHQILAEFPSNHIVVLTSEKNGAVEAVAEHLWNACTANDRVTDVAFFEKIAAFGSAGMKERTRSFTHQEKVGNHPELCASSNSVNQKKQQWANAVSRCKAVLRDRDLNQVEELEEVLEFISLSLDNITVADITGAVEKLEDLIKRGGKHDGVVRPVLSKLKSDARGTGTSLLSALATADEQYRQAMEDDRALVAAVMKRMVASTRVFLATIGSMEKVHSAVKGRVVDVGEGDDEYFGYCQTEDVTHADLRFHSIIDEASTVPQFEICSLGIIGQVDTLHIVGDPNQLQPFSPARNASQHPVGGASLSDAVKGRERGGRNEAMPVTVHSIFKVATVARGYLELQYRIPRLIANLLDKHIYKGKYKSHTSVAFNPFPVLLVHVPTELPVISPAGGGSGRNSDKGGRGRGGRGGRGGGGGRERNNEINPIYVNAAEARTVLELLQRCKQLKRDDVLVLTPYRQQMYEIKHQLKDAGVNFDDSKIITGDQVPLPPFPPPSPLPPLPSFISPTHLSPHLVLCSLFLVSCTALSAYQSQGMEADYVIISLTNSRPTKVPTQFVCFPT